MRLAEPGAPRLQDTHSRETTETTEVSDPGRGMLAITTERRTAARRAIGLHDAARAMIPTGLRSLVSITFFLDIRTPAQAGLNSTVLQGEPRSVAQSRRIDGMKVERGAGVKTSAAARTKVLGILRDRRRGGWPCRPG